MSQGDFIDVKIESVTDPTMIYWGRVQKETAEAVFGSAMNTEATMDPTETISAYISKSRRQRGFRPALVNFRWDGDAPANYTGSGGRIPALTQAAFKQASIMGAMGTYLGKMINITSVTRESIV